MDKSTTLLVPSDNAVDPFVLYARSLYNYTLSLWTETRRIAEEKSHAGQMTSLPISAIPTKAVVDDETEKTENTSPSRSEQSPDNQT